MTAAEKRIAIAELCGWTWKGPEGFECWWQPGGSFMGMPLYAEQGRTKESGAYALPDYLHSLDAMHAAEKLLTSHGRQCKYMKHLAYGHMSDTSQRAWPTWHASASVRADAFLYAHDVLPEEQDDA